MSAIIKPFQIFLCWPPKLVKKVLVIAEMKISKLKVFFQISNSNVFFVYDGKKLDENRTLSYYGIGPNAEIIVLSENSDYSHKWLLIMKKSETFREKMKGVLNPLVKTEIYRLNDIRIMRLETDPKKHFKRLEHFNTDACSNINKIETILGGPLSEPASDPFPYTW